MKTDAELVADLIAANDEMAARGLAEMPILRAHIAKKMRRDEATGRMGSALNIPAPLDFFTGAPAAQNPCATGPSALSGKPSGAKRATAALPVAQQQQAGLSPNRADHRQSIKNGGFK